jgi:uridine kinase
MGADRPYIIGIAGGSASGKTTLIKELNARYSEEQICVISQDHYYKPLSEQVVDENGEVNFDLPEGIDFKRLARDIRSLKKGRQVKIVEYTFNNPDIFPRQLIFKPAPILVVEGLFIYTSKALSSMIDLKLYIHADLEVMLNRRLVRDAEERGMTKDQIMYQWEQHVLPAYENYLLPYKNSVDMVIENNTDFNESFNQLVIHLNQLLDT